MGFKPFLTQTVPDTWTVSEVLRLLQQRRHRFRKLFVVKFEVLVDQVTLKIKAAVVAIDFEVAHQARELALEFRGAAVDF